MDGHGNAVAAPVDEFRLPTDEDELRELAAAGVALDAGEDGKEAVLIDRSTDATEDLARVAGMTAFYLGRVATVDADASLLTETKRFELARVERAYAPQLLDLAKRREYFETRIRQFIDLANGLGAFAKKKSIKTSRGTFGMKAVPAKAKITDNDAVLAWAAEAMPDCVRVTVQVNLSDLNALRDVCATSGIQLEYEGRPLLNEKSREVLISELEKAGVDLVKATIPGITVTPATSEYVIKPVADA